MLQKPTSNEAAGGPIASLIFVVEDDGDLRSALRDLLEANGMIVEDFACAEDFLMSVHSPRKACLLLDVGLEGEMSGIDVLRRLQDSNRYIPTIFITGNGDVEMAIEGMMLGAVDFLQKPIVGSDLLSSIADALAEKCLLCDSFVACHGATDRVSEMTVRQQQLMELILSGCSGKSASGELGINRRTAEKHRAAMMERMGVKSIFALAQLSFAAEGIGFCGHPIPGRRRGKKSRRGERPSARADIGLSDGDRLFR